MTHLIKHYRILICLAVVFAPLAFAFPQKSASLFDLLPRTASGAASDSTIALSISPNPFDIVKTQPSRRSSSTPGFSVVKTKKTLSVKEKESIYRRFLFIAILTMMVILTLAFTVFRILIEKIWKAFLNDNLLNQLMREQGAGLTLAYLILYAVFFINAGIFLFLVCRHFGVQLAGSNFVSLLICIGAVLGFLVFKHLLLQVVGYVFPVKKEIGVYNFTIIIFNIVIGFFLVPAIFFTAYAPSSVTEYVIYGSAIVLILVFLFRNLRGLFIANRFLAWHKFHFLLYLCAVEIAPLLIGAKFLLSYQSA